MQKSKLCNIFKQIVAFMPVYYIREKHNIRTVYVKHTTELSSTCREHWPWKVQRSKRGNLVICRFYASMQHQRGKHHSHTFWECWYLEQQLKWRKTQTGRKIHSYLVNNKSLKTNLLNIQEVHVHICIQNVFSAFMLLTVLLHVSFN